jgi:transcriptional regulator with XRE-family HTH domain
MARTPKTQALGRAIRQIREDAGLTVRELAERVGVNHGTQSRWETGDRAPKPENVTRILTLLNITGEKYTDIMTMAYGVDQPTWVAVTLPEQRQQLQALVEFEREASRITVVSPLVVHGLLQTDAYVQAIMSIGDLSPDEVRKRSKVRSDRRDVLIKQRQAPRYLAFVDLSVLHKIIGGRQVMAEQIRHMIEMAALPNVEIRIVPLDSGWHPGLAGSFILLETPDLGPIVHLENLVSGQFLHERSDVNAYLRAVDMLLEVALNPDESVRLMANVANRMEHSP